MENELFEHLFMVLSLYLKARIRIRIRIQVKGRIRIRIKSRTICNTDWTEGRKVSFYDDKHSLRRWPTISWRLAETITYNYENSSKKKKRKRFLKGLYRYIQYREHDRLITAFLQKVMTINENGKKGPMIYNRGHFIYYFPHDFWGRTYYLLYEKVHC